MEVATAISGNPIRLTDVLQQGDFGALLAARYYDKEPLADGFIVAVYREVGEEDGFLITAYFARRLSATRKVLWNR